MGHHLAPGFRFHPTDEELVGYYLKRKVFGKSFPIDAISVVDVYRSEPWDLPDKSRMKSRDLEWYFFSALDRKYGNGSKTNRATEKGYWKTTGKDRVIRNGPRTIGLKKTLVYHFGRAPRGQRTNWVMHEYKLADEQLLQFPGANPVAYVVCRIFQKSGPGPQNGEQHGAPFVEEEWEDDDDVLALGPVQPAAVPLVPLPPPLEVAHFEPNYFAKDLHVDVSFEKAPLPLNCVDHSNSAGRSLRNEDNALTGRDKSHLAFQLPDDLKFSGLHAWDGIGFENFMEECVGVNPDDETYLDASNNPPLDFPSFIEADDLSKLVKGDVSGLDSMDECLAYFDAEDIDSQVVAFDCEEDMNVQSEQGSVATQQILDAQNRNSAASKQNRVPEESDTDIHHPLLKKARRMLGSIPAPPAFASEIPSRETLLRLNTIAQSSNLVHVTSGVTESSVLRMKWSCTENGKINCFLSLVLPRRNFSQTNLNSVTGFFHLLKMTSTLSWERFYSMFQYFIGPVLFFGYKVGTWVYSS